MAELLIKIKPNPQNPTGLQDGDIINAFNNLYIKRVHAECICNPAKEQFNSDGLRPKGCLADMFLSKVSEFKLQRVGANEAKKIRLSDMAEVNDPWLVIAGIDEFFMIRKQNPKHQVFGTAGSEYIYGGRRSAPDSVLNDIWAEIEYRTPLREVDHRKSPMRGDEFKFFLALTVTDFDDRRRALYESPLHRTETRFVAERLCCVPWRDIDNIPAVTKNAVYNPGIATDLRDYGMAVTEDIVEIKGLKPSKRKRKLWIR